MVISLKYLAASLKLVAVNEEPSTALLLDIKILEVDIGSDDVIVPIETDNPEVDLLLSPEC